MGFFFESVDRLVCLGSVSATRISWPASSIKSFCLTSTEANMVQPDKFVRRWTIRYSIPQSTTVAAVTSYPWWTRADCTLTDFTVIPYGSVPTGTKAYSVDLKQGITSPTSILSAAVTVNSGSTVRVAQAGTISTSAIEHPDALIFVITESGTGTQGTGLIAECRFDQLDRGA